jgi:WD40 repeat protein
MDKNLTPVSNNASSTDENPNTEEKNNEEDLLQIDVMSLLDRQVLARIKKDFMRWEGQAVPKLEFITLMLQHLPHSYDRIEMTIALKELFEQIDVNHDEVMEWEEFSNYIVESGMIKKDRTFLDAIKNYTPQDWVDPIIHKNEIEHLFFLPKLRHLLVMESDSKEFKVYELKNNKFSFAKTVKGHRGTVTAACHATGSRKVATSANDLTINLWDESTYILNQRISCPTFPLILAWNHKYNTLYSSGTDAIIYAWDLKEGREKMNSIKMWNPFSTEDDKSGHKTVVAALLPIKKMNILVSADLHGNIFLWDMPHNTKRRQLRGQSKGIYSLDWNSEHSCLFSAGLDREAYVWNPYVEREIFKLAGHNHSLVGVKCVPKTSQVVTGDISGLFRVWDIRTFSTIQTFNIGAKELNCFEVIYPDKKIVSGTKKIQIYQYDEPQDRHLADEGCSISTFYNSLFNTFITVHSKTIKIWNGENGKLEHVFRDVMKGDISCAVLDKYQRKIYLGDSTGRIRSVDIKNGAKVKKFSKHKEEVTGLVYWPENRILISSSWDKKIKIHDDSKIEEDNQVRYKIKQHVENVNSISLHYTAESPTVGLLASGSNDGIIHITKLVSYRPDSKIETEASEIKFLMFLNPSACLACVDADGLVTFWIINSGRNTKKPIYKIQNRSNIDENSICCVKSIAYCHNKRYFYTGDEQGYLKVYEVGYLVDKLANPFMSMTFLTDDRPLKYLSRSSFITVKNDRSPANLVKFFQAHKDAVNHIGFVEDQDLVITSSFDCNVHIWNNDGVKVGTLILGTDKNWAIKSDIEAKNNNRRQEAKNIIRKIVEKKDAPGYSNINDIISDLPKSYEAMIKKHGDINTTFSDEDLDEDDILELIREPTTFANTQVVVKHTEQKNVIKQISSQSDLLKPSRQKSIASSKSGFQRAGLSMLKLG